MKRIKIILFAFGVLAFGNCCKIWSAKSTEKCNCKEFENYIKTWKVDEKSDVFYVDISATDEEKYLELQEIFIRRLDCLIGKTVGEVRTIFNGKKDMDELIIPKSKECATCFINKNDCEYFVLGKVRCSYFRIRLDKDDSKIITGTGESLKVDGHYIYFEY